MSGTNMKVQKSKVHDMGKIIIVDKSKSSKLPASKERRKNFSNQDNRWENTKMIILN